MSERDAILAILEAATGRGNLSADCIERNEADGEIIVNNGNPGCAVYLQFDRAGNLTDVGTCPG